jgi:putative ATP-binding cassette transporter
LRTAWKKEMANFEIFCDFLNGFKEIKMNSLRARDISLLMVESSRESTQIKAAALISLSNFFNYLQILLYVVVGIIIFIVPIFSSDFSASVLPVTTVSIFLVGSLSGVITTVPMLSEANSSARSLLNLEKDLQGNGVQDDEPLSQEDLGVFNGISTSKNVANAGHMGDRSRCLNSLTSIYGRVPLVISHVIVDHASNGWTNVPSSWWEFISSDLWKLE